MSVYLLTIAPTLSFFDSGEMIAGSYTLGVSHPPGYPVYVTLGKLFTFLPINNVAFRVNLMSSFFAAMTSVMIYYITRAMLMEGNKKKSVPAGPAWLKAPEAAGMFSALAFSLSYNLWAWAVVSKFYTLNAFVVSCMLMLLLRWRRARREEGDVGGGHSLSYLYAIAFLCGIAAVVHISQFALIPVYMVYILIVDGSAILGVPEIKKLIREPSTYIILLIFIILELTAYPRSDSAADFSTWGKMLLIIGMVFLALMLVLALVLFHKKNKSITIKKSVTPIFIILAVFILLEVVILYLPDEYYLNKVLMVIPFTLLFTYLLIRETIKFKVVAIMGFFLLLGHSIYMHLPIRAAQEPLINWGIATDWAQFKWVYNREGYPSVGGARDWALFWDQIKSFNLVREFTWAGIPLILFGLVGHYKKDWRHFTVLVFGSVFMTMVIVLAGNPPKENIFLLEQFYIPVYIFLTVIMGGAVYLILEGNGLGPWILALTLPFMFLGELPTGYLESLFTGNAAPASETGYPPYLFFILYAVLACIIFFGVRTLLKVHKPGYQLIYVAVFAVLFILYPAYQLKAHYWKNDRSKNFIAYDMGNAELTSSPEFSVLFTWGDSGAFPMWYLQDVERKRPDVLLVHTPHLPLGWFLHSISREAGDLGDSSQIARDYNLLRNFNGIKGVEQMLSTPEEFRDPAAMIKEVIKLNKGRVFTFDYSSRYSVDMPYPVFPYGITYRPLEEDYVEQNIKIWRYLVTRGLPEPTEALDPDETKAVMIYGYVYADFGKKLLDMGLEPLARQQFAEAVKYSPDLSQAIATFLHR